MHAKGRTMIDLFATFFRIGLFTFGGGYAMIPLIEREAVEKKGWIEEKDVLDILAIAESTPGPLAINSATFVGCKMAGVAGAAAATLGVVLPSFAIIGLISLVLQQFMQNQWVAWAFLGVRAGVTVLILNAVLKLGKACKRSPFTWIVAAVAFALSAFTSLDVIVILLGAAAAGVARLLWRVRGGKDGAK